ncbi:MAG TPA: lysophospholipid acyltransferase family protein [Bacteroidia bacterium]|nr:lysophospholipid acyltransferase family protein [Bacteroidia bacterium]
MIIIRFLRSIFGIYGLLFSVVNLFLHAPVALFIIAFFPKRSQIRYAHKVARSWSFLYSLFLFMPMRIRNKNFIDRNTTYVFVANHRSQLDIPVYTLASPNTMRFLAKAELTKIPIFGYLVKTLYVTVNREERADRHKSLEVMKRSLDEGVSVFLCPEGTRNKKLDPPLLDFRDGAFRLAIASQTPVAVLTVLNSGEKLSPVRPFELAPGTIHAVWDKPIETKGMTEQDLPELKEKVRAMMIEHLRAFRQHS